MKHLLSLFSFVVLVIFSMAAFSDVAGVLKGDKKLACEAKLCLMTGGGGRPGECQPSIDEFRKILKRKGPGRAKRWLDSCPDGDDGSHSDYVISCSNERIFDYLYVREYEDGYSVKRKAAADVPAVCKKFVQKLNHDAAEQRAKLPAEYQEQVPDVSLLPVRSMKWVLVSCGNGDGAVCDRDYYKPVYEWSYQDNIPAGYSVSYDPNSGKRFPAPACPSANRSFWGVGCRSGVSGVSSTNSRFGFR